MSKDRDSEIRKLEDLVEGTTKDLVAVDERLTERERDEVTGAIRRSKAFLRRYARRVFFAKVQIALLALVIVLVFASLWWWQRAETPMGSRLRPGIAPF